MTSVTAGIEALADTRVKVQPRGEMGTLAYVETSQGRQYQRSFSGNGADSDIVVSSVRAYVSALNKLISFLAAREEETSSADEGEESEPATTTATVTTTTTP